MGCGCSRDGPRVRGETDVPQSEKATSASKKATLGPSFTAKKSQRHYEEGNNGKYIFIRDLEPSNGCELKLMRVKKSGELVAVKFIDRTQGAAMDKNSEREIINHRKLLHPNIIRFKEAYLPTDYLAIVMEYAPTSLFDEVTTKGCLSEDQARKWFTQLVSGVNYCHSQGIYHRDLKLENLYINENGDLKIAEFGFSKSSMFDSQPKTTVGSPAYTPPEVLLGQAIGNAYDGGLMDLWSCGVLLYIMLCGKYPFEDPDNPGSFRLTLQRILKVHYSFPKDIPLSDEVKDLLNCIFVADPGQRISATGILNHPWISLELANANFEEDIDAYGANLQSLEEVEKLMNMA